MVQIIQSLLIYVMVCVLAPPSSAEPVAASGGVYATHPAQRSDGARWRVGYFESGDYEEYPRILRAIALGLQQLGWIRVPPMHDGMSGRQIWEHLSRNSKSDVLEFVEDAYWQPGDFDQSERAAIRRKIDERLRQRGDVDLIIAMGTWAGQDMAALRAPVPTVVASVSDAVGAHIVHSAIDSGLENMHARVQPERYQRQVRLFHDMVAFRSLGLVYESSPAGRSYAAVDAVEQVARERGFAVFSCDAPSSGIHEEEATRNAIRCYGSLLGKVDAVYVTTHRGMTLAAVKRVAEMLRAAKTPSFAMLGADQVRAGLLMSLAQADYSSVGRFHAETIARIFNGAPPRRLTQIWTDPTKIALNLDTALRTGFEPTVDMLLAVDEVYGQR